MAVRMNRRHPQKDSLGGRSLESRHRLRLCSLISLSSADHVHKCLFALDIKITYGYVPTLTLAPNCSRALLTYSSSSFSGTFKLGTNGESRDKLSPYLLHQFRTLLPPHLDRFRKKFPQNYPLLTIQWMAWLLLGGFITSWDRCQNFLVSSLNNFSANNDVSMHFRGQIEEPYSSVLYFQIHPYFIFLQPNSFNFTSYFIPSSTLTLNARTSK